MPMLRLDPREPEAAGPLQEKILVALLQEPLCGVDLMKRLRIRSPGTIYPALEALRSRRLIDYRLETSGSVRRNVYSLTADGRGRLRRQLAQSARTYCCDPTLHMDRILGDAKGFLHVRAGQRVLSTLEFDAIKRALPGAEIAFSHDLDVAPDRYDWAVSFLGVGLLMGRGAPEISDYVRRLHRALKRGGSLLLVEVEKTDNVFARVFFEDVVGLTEAPGMDRERLALLLGRAGFTAVDVASRSGLLYALARKA